MAGMTPEQVVEAARAAAEAARNAADSAQTASEQAQALADQAQLIADGAGEGEITSGSFSPTLQRAIAFARVPKATGDTCQVDIRGKLLTARVVKPPFARNGKPQIEL